MNELKRGRTPGMKMQPQQLAQVPALTSQGLSEDEVAARRAQGLGNTMPVKTSRSYVQIARENIFNPINNLLYTLGIALAVLGKISDALISVGVVSLLTGESNLIEKRPGDHLYSGSFCVNGSAYYQAEKVGAQSVAYGLTVGARAFRRIYTPLQREISLIIRIILLVAIFLEFLM